MNMLPAEIQEHYYSLTESDNNFSAKAIIHAFFNEYNPVEAEKELWLLFSGAITSKLLPNSEHPEERECMLRFYEWMKAVLGASYFLRNDK